MTISKRHTLRINGLHLPVILGWFEEERQATQDISINVEIRFAKLPEATGSDELDETVCYATIVERLKEFLNFKTFKLIEFCAEEIHIFLKSFIPHPLSVNVKKLQIPVDEIKGHCSFEVSDF